MNRGSKYALSFTCPFVSSKSGARLELRFRMMRTFYRYVNCFWLRPDSLCTCRYVRRHLEPRCERSTALTWRRASSKEGCPSWTSFKMVQTFYDCVTCLWLRSQTLYVIVKCSYHLGSRFEKSTSFYLSTWIKQRGVCYLLGLRSLMARTSL
jgi:hypothetical protein